MRRWTIGLAILLVVGAVAVIAIAELRAAGRGSPPGVEPALANSPEGKLVYPNARNINRTGALAECRDGVWQPAALEVTFGTPDSIQNVDRWYADELTLLGWRAEGDPGPSYLLTRGNNDEFFQVDVHDSSVMTLLQRDVRTGSC